MTTLLLLLLLQAVPPSAPVVAPDVDEVVVTAPAPDSVWCVRFPNGRGRRREPSPTCRTLAEWDAVRRTRYDSRGYQEQLALRRFGVGIDSSLMEEAAMGRVRNAMRARRRVAERSGEAADPRPAASSR